mmetsp:Transcript_90785/g.257173  ORF Transcript_90785/g.257173 Transcript_90785/m.257173 type:complete len:124 (+) Transcript_90785:96-467(+)
MGMCCCAEYNGNAVLKDRVLRPSRWRDAVPAAELEEYEPMIPCAAGPPKAGARMQPQKQHRILAEPINVRAPWDGCGGAPLAVLCASLLAMLLALMAFLCLHEKTGALAALCPPDFRGMCCVH